MVVCAGLLSIVDQLTILII